MSRSEKGQIADDLRRRILILELEPGALLDEVGLAAHYGVSRTPIRDVLRELGGEGYVALKNRRGEQVAPQVSPMNTETMRDFFQTAPLIYSTIGRLAARNASVGAIEALCEIQRSFRQSQLGRDVFGMVTGNDRFHAAIGEMADNAYLFPSYQRLLIDHARIGQTFWRQNRHGDSSPSQVETAANQHDQFIDFLREGDEQSVVQLTLDHWELSRQFLERYVRPDPLPLVTAAAI